MSECLVQSLSLPCTPHSVQVSGIAGLSPKGPIRSVANLQVSATGHAGRRINLTAIVVPKVTPLSPVPFNLEWKHLTDLTLADPSFGQPGQIDLLLGVDNVLLHGRRSGPPGAPVALETEFGWVLSGSTEYSASANQVNLHVTSFHTSTLTGDDLRVTFGVCASSFAANMSVRQNALDHSRVPSGV